MKPGCAEQAVLLVLEPRKTTLIYAENVREGNEEVQKKGLYGSSDACPTPEPPYRPLNIYALMTADAPLTDYLLTLN